MTGEGVELQGTDSTQDFWGWWNYSAQLQWELPGKSTTCINSDRGTLKKKKNPFRKKFKYISATT